MNINGHHHISMITKDAKRNNAFYTKVLGLRRVNMTVNQDSPNMYHLFYGDRTGAPGTELTFFEIPNAGQTHKGTNSISRIGLFVPTIESLDYWKGRFTQFGVAFQEEVTEYANKTALHFRDHEMLEMVLLVVPENTVLPAHWEAWEKSDVPQQHRILGMASVELKVRNPKATVELLHDIFGYEVVAQQGNETIIQTKSGGVLSELVLIEEDGPAEKPGRGSVHHVAIRVENVEQLQKYDELLKARRIGTSSVVDRHYFESVYFRDANNILFELATDEPGFAKDGNYDHLGIELELPPKFESQREAIISKLRPLS